MWGSSEISFLSPTLTGLCFRIPSPGPVNRYMPKAHEPVWSWCTWHRWWSYQTMKGRTPIEINDDWYYNYLFAEWEHIRMKRGSLARKMSSRCISGYGRPRPSLCPNVWNMKGKCIRLAFGKQTGLAMQCRRLNSSWSSMSIRIFWISL